MGTDICSRSAASGINCGAAAGSGAEGTDDIQQWSITATVDHALTDSLTARAEYRYDGADADNADSDFFANRRAIGSSAQHLVIAEMLYQF